MDRNEASGEGGMRTAGRGARGVEYRPPPLSEALPRARSGYAVMRGNSSVGAQNRKGNGEEYRGGRDGELPVRDLSQTHQEPNNHVSLSITL